MSPKPCRTTQLCLSVRCRRPRSARRANRLACLVSEDDHLVTKEDDTWGRLKGSYSYTFVRRYPVRRAAAEEIHIAFGQTTAVIEECTAVREAEEQPGEGGG